MRIFISYAREDLGIAAHLSDALEAAGHDVWIDVERIRTPGHNWRRLVVQGIRGSDVLVALLTPRSAASAHVERELAVADELGTEILPIVVERCSIGDGLLYPLAALHHLDVSSLGTAAAVDSIVSHIDRRGAEVGAVLAR
jgi:hypothetical protein